MSDKDDSDEQRPQEPQEPDKDRGLFHDDGFEQIWKNIKNVDDKRS